MGISVGVLQFAVHQSCIHKMFYDVMFTTELHSQNVLRCHVHQSCIHKMFYDVMFTTELHSQNVLRCHVHQTCIHKMFYDIMFTRVAFTKCSMISCSLELLRLRSKLSSLLLALWALGDSLKSGGN